jgi:hypothetical protein
MQSDLSENSGVQKEKAPVLPGLQVESEQSL